MHSQHGCLVDEHRNNDLRLLDFKLEHMGHPTERPSGANVLSLMFARVMPPQLLRTDLSPTTTSPV